MSDNPEDSFTNKKKKTNNVCNIRFQIVLLDIYRAHTLSTHRSLCINTLYYVAQSLAGEEVKSLPQDRTIW